MTATMERGTADAKIPTTFGETVRDLYSHASPMILTVLAVGFVSARVVLGNWSAADLVAPIVLLLIWPILEWLIHVYILHLRPQTIFGKTIDLSVSRSHREHHSKPTDLTDITINLEVYPVVVPLLAGLVFWLFPSVELAVGALAMFFTLALHYEWNHFIGHVNWSPPLEYYRRRQRMHRLHHFRNEQLWWGVSTGIGDLMMGTAPDAKSVERSPTADNVHGLNKQPS